MTRKDDQNGKPRGGLMDIGRRSLLKLAGAAGVGLPLAAYMGRAPWRGVTPAEAHVVPRTRGSYWRDGYFVQDTVDDSRFEEGIVSARIEGEWRDYYNRELGQDFLDWNIGQRLWALEDPMRRMGDLAGPHSGCLATYGANRGDSAFTLNAAFKGFGFYPNGASIDDALDELIDNWNADMMVKLDILRSFYSDRSMWDFRLLSSIELYTTQEFETHSFLNQMANPIATIAWLAIPGAFEVRAIARLYHPEDPDIPEEAWKRVRWVPAVHDFYHGGPRPDLEPPSRIACVYYVVEAFDNSPYPGNMGIRTTPAL